MRGAGTERSLETSVAQALALEPGEVVLVAVSGGPDSTALASLAASAAGAARARIVLGHVNHGVRRTAGQDEAVTLAVASVLGAGTRFAYLEGVASGEAALREARYAALAELARGCGAKRVATAHHAQDQCETVLLALFRGTGPAGLAGMPETRALDGDLKLVRPLLRVAPTELRAHAERLHLPFVLDPSNCDPRYRRSGLRRVLSELRRDFPHLDESVARCAALVRDEFEPTVRARGRAELHDVLRAAGAAQDITFERFEAAARALERGTRGRIRLRRGVELVIDGTGEPSA